MAFIQRNWALESTGGYDSEAPQAFAYKSSADSIATIKGSGYFNNVRPLPNIGDKISIWGSDGSDIVRVTAVSPNITVTDWVAISVSELPLTDGSMYMGNGSNVAIEVAVKSYILLDGRHTTAGGDATEVITATGAVAGDQCIVVVHTVGATPRSIVAQATGTDIITVTLSGDPSTDHVLYWQVLRTTT